MGNTLKLRTPTFNWDLVKTIVPMWTCDADCCFAIDHFMCKAYAPLPQAVRNVSGHPDIQIGCH